MSTPIKITPETPPERPCWIYHPTASDDTKWWHISGGLPIDWIGSGFTHWLPDQSDAPTVVPQGKAERDPLTDAEADSILSIIDHRQRLGGMTAKELVLETLGTDAADYSCVVELMNRVMPGWETALTDNETESSPDSMEKRGPKKLFPAPHPDEAQLREAVRRWALQLNWGNVEKPWTPAGEAALLAAITPLLRPAVRGEAELPKKGEGR